MADCAAGVDILFPPGAVQRFLLVCRWTILWSGGCQVMQHFLEWQAVGHSLNTKEPDLQPLFVAPVSRLSES